MSQQVTISSVTANTPVDVYYCDAFSGSCVFVSSASTFPFVFTVPSPYDQQDFIIKIVDFQGCEIGLLDTITPTPTPSITPSPTYTPTTTPTSTTTPTFTPTNTPTLTQTPTTTPTNTPSYTPTQVLVSHTTGQNLKCDENNACADTLSSNLLFNYLTEATTTPVLGITLYSTENNSVLYNPYNGGGQWLLMSWISGNYAVKISSQGTIQDFTLCS